MNRPKARRVSALRCALFVVSTTLLAQSGAFLRDAGHWEGLVTMRVADDLKTGTSRTVVSLRTADGSLEIAPESVDPGWKPNQRISIDGHRSGTRIAIDHWAAQDVRSAVSASAPQAVSGACSTTGEQKVAVLMLSFPSTPFPSYVTASYVQSTLFGPDPSTAGLISAASYGQATVTGQVLGPISMPTDYPVQDFEDIANAAIDAADQLIDLRQYNRIVMMAPTKLVAGDPEAFIGCLQLNSPSYGPFNGSLVFMPAEEATSPSYFYRAIAHELGHNFGAEHSNSLDYGVETLGPPGFMGLSTEYGDEFVTMGGEFPGHYVAQHKVMFGWLASNTGFRSVSASGSYTLEPYGTATGGLKALRVTRGTGGSSYLWIEYRQPTDPYETNMGTLSQSIYSGAYIHYDSGSGSAWTYLPSFQPNSANKFVTPVLTAGSSWADPYSDLLIQVGAPTSAGLPITVTYGNKPGCATSVSPATVQPSSAGGAATLNVTAPGSCSWTATSNVSWITFTGSSSGTGNGTINYTVAANSLSQARFGRITAGGMSLGVVQAEAPGNITAIGANSITFPATGGSGQLAITASTADYAWSVPFDWNWVQVTSATGVGSGTMIYVVGENTGPARSVTIPVGNFNYVISQAAGSPASSQMDWLQLDTTGAMPSPRFSEGVAYFGPTGETILYGGIRDSTYYDDTWGWNGSVWTQKSPAHSPGTRVGHVMVYDPVRQQTVMFGGYSPSSPYQLNDTWIWNGTDWTLLHPVHSPPIRANAVAAFDTTNKVLVLFGGTNYQGELNDTWVWDGTDWTQKFPLTSPPARDSQAMAYDPVRQETVMFGGAESPQAGDPGGTWYQDTWTWDAPTGT